MRNSISRISPERLSYLLFFFFCSFPPKKETQNKIGKQNEDKTISCAGLQIKIMTIDFHRISIVLASFIIITNGFDFIPFSRDFYRYIVDTQQVSD